MPYVLLKIGNKRAGLKDIVWLERDIANWQRNSKKSESITLVNTTTRRLRKVKGINQ